MRLKQLDIKIRIYINFSYNTEHKPEIVQKNIILPNKWKINLCMVLKKKSI